VPVADLVKCPDTDLYWSTMREHPTLGSEEIEQLANVGVMFRSLAATHWEAQSLECPWLDWPMSNLRHFDTRLADSIQALGLS